MKVALPRDEAQRLESLRQYAVLDTPPEKSFDDLTLLAAHICQTPIALVSLVDRSRGWFKSKIGVSDAEISRDCSFSAHAILNEDEVLEVRDKKADPRFTNSLGVMTDPPIRFYAGAPLVTPAGHALGALCVLDHTPRALTAEQLAALRTLSRQVMSELELRRQARELEMEAAKRRRAEALLSQELSGSQEEVDLLLAMASEADRALVTVLEDQQRAARKLRDSEECFRHFAENITDVFWMISPDLQQVFYVSPAYEHVWGRPVARLREHPLDWAEAIPPEDRERVMAIHGRLVQGEPSVSMEFPITRSDGEVRWIGSRGFPVRDAAGRLLRITGIASDITERKQAEQRHQIFLQEILAEREKERKRISCILHHDVGSLAVGMLAHFDAIETALHAANLNESIVETKRAMKLFENSMVCLKGLAGQLRPPELAALGLAAALQQHFDQITLHRGTKVYFTDDLGRTQVPENTAAILFRVAQEALTNAVLHGQAGLVKVSLRAVDHDVKLFIHDNGSGFDSGRQSSPGKSNMGLRAMREMVVAGGGRFAINSEPHHGTTVLVSLPLGGGEVLEPGNFTQNKRTAPGGDKDSFAGRASRPQNGNPA